MNKETVEEVAEKKYTPGVYVINGIDICEAAKECFIEGAEWQKEKSYSEEDMKKCWDAACAFTVGSYKYFKQTHPNFKEWFEQFKKKV